MPAERGRTQEGRRAVLVGCGLIGPLLAILLVRRGWTVDVYEMRPDGRREATAGARSINLTLAERGLAALREVGLEQEVLTKLCTPLRGRAVHRQTGQIVLMPYGNTTEEVIYAASRAALTNLLVDAAEDSGVGLHFGARCVSVDRDAPSVTLLEHATGRQRTVEADVVIGADGTYSTVRRFTQHGIFADLNLHYVPWRYKELTLSAGLDPNAMHAWPRGDRMMFAQPNTDGTFNGVAVLPAAGENSFETLTTPERIRRFFGENFADVAGLIPDLAEQFTTHPVAAFPTLTTSHWYHEGNVVLAGDACHSVIPFYGQGMNAGFEDCVVLDRCMAEDPDRLDRAFRRYQSLRRPHTDVLARLSIENFTEMRERTRGFAVAARKRLIQRLHEIAPERIVPLYTLVAHSNVPYADCVAQAARQDRVLRMLGGDIAVAVMAASDRLRALAGTRHT